MFSGGSKGNTGKKRVKSSKATGIDKLWGSFLKDGADILAKPVSVLRFLTRSLSKCLQSCGTKDYIQKGKKADPSNYRPIILLPAISKIIEKVIHDQTNTFFFR